MAKRPDTLDTALLMVELLRRIPRGRKITMSSAVSRVSGRLAIEGFSLSKECW